MVAGGVAPPGAQSRRGGTISATAGRSSRWVPTAQKKKRLKMVAKRAAKRAAKQGQGQEEEEQEEPQAANSGASPIGAVARAGLAAAANVLRGAASAARVMAFS